MKLPNALALASLCLHVWKKLANNAHLSTSTLLEFRRRAKRGTLIWTLAHIMLFQDLPQQEDMEEFKHGLLKTGVPISGSVVIIYEYSTAQAEWFWLPFVHPLCTLELRSCIVLTMLKKMSWLSGGMTSTTISGSLATFHHSWWLTPTVE